MTRMISFESPLKVPITITKQDCHIVSYKATKLSPKNKHSYTKLHITTINLSPSAISFPTSLKFQNTKPRNIYSLCPFHFAPLSILICLLVCTFSFFGNGLNLIYLISSTDLYYVSILTCHLYIYSFFVIFANQIFHYTKFSPVSH